MPRQEAFCGIEEERGKYTRVSLSECRLRDGVRHHWVIGLFLVQAGGIMREEQGIDVETWQRWYRLAKDYEATRRRHLLDVAWSEVDAAIRDHDCKGVVQRSFKLSPEQEGDK
jgi:hypothetical protein